jgi:anti-sigma factor RsiW
VNCHPAEKLLSAERDQTLGADLRAELEAHLAECPSCRKRRALLAESAAAWRVTSAEARVPDERIEWQHIRRRIGGETADAQPAWRIFSSWRGATVLAAAAAVMLGIFLVPRESERATPAISATATAMAATDTVEIGGDASAAMVFVDDKSGWLVVWASATGG